MAQCTHLDQIHEVTPSGNGCKECLEMGDSWVHLIMSFEPGEDWGWCYVDDVYLEAG